MAKKIFGPARGSEQAVVEVESVEVAPEVLEPAVLAPETIEPETVGFPDPGGDGTGLGLRDDPKPEKPKKGGVAKPAKDAAPAPAAKRQMFRQVPNLTAGLEGASAAMFSSALNGDAEMERLFREGIQGMPQEHLFLQVVMGMDVVPVGQNISLIGEASSCKTWLGWELAKPFVYNGGMTYLIRAEKKWDPESARAILTLARNPDYDPFLKPGADPDYEQLDGPNPFFCLVPEVFSLKTEKQNGFISVLCAESIEEIQKSVIADSMGIAAMYGKELGKGKEKTVIPRFPVYFLFDSLQYVTSESVMDAIEKEKEEGYADMHRASAFKRFLQTWANRQQAQNPFTMNTINHRKPETEGRVEAGGFFKEALYLLKLFLKKDTFQMNNKTGVDGTMPIVGMRPHKNSMGAEHGYDSQVKMRIWIDPSDATGYPLRAAFLWEEALAEMLTPNGLSKLRKSATIPKQLGYEFKGNKFICPRLGFTEKNPASPVNFAVAASRSPEFSKAFQDVFGVRRLKKYEF